MKDFDSLIGIWNEQKTAPVIDYKEIINSYKAKRDKLTLKFLREILMMLPALVVIVYLFFAIEFNFWTSYVGLFITASCCLYFIIAQLVNIKNVSDSNTLFDQPKDHILFIRKFKKARLTQHTRNYKIYTLVLGFGLSLYFVEFFYMLNVWLMVLVVGATIAWFIVCYIYLNKMYLVKEEKRFNDMITDLERLNEQFKDVE
jgi:hypothetical protein